MRITVTLISEVPVGDSKKRNAVLRSDLSMSSNQKIGRRASAASDGSAEARTETRC
ncbi:MAG: hypothetical protein KAR85_04505 [Methanosarcinales archaeon]|nr:hypothetical protein [Methanosarcinales archaeon]